MLVRPGQDIKLIPHNQKNKYDSGIDYECVVISHELQDYKTPENTYMSRDILISYETVLRFTSELNNIEGWRFNTLTHKFDSVHQCISRSYSLCYKNPVIVISIRYGTSKNTRNDIKVSMSRNDDNIYNTLILLNSGFYNNLKYTEKNKTTEYYNNIQWNSLKKYLNFIGPYNTDIRPPKADEYVGYSVVDKDYTALIVDYRVLEGFKDQLLNIDIYGYPGHTPITTLWNIIYSEHYQHWNGLGFNERYIKIENTCSGYKIESVTNIPPDGIWSDCKRIEQGILTGSEYYNRRKVYRGNVEWKELKPFFNMGSAASHSFFDIF